MKQFSLKEYLENPSCKVVTRDRRNARIICTDLKKFSCVSFHIIALVADGDEDEIILTYRENGQCGFEENDFDLFFAPEDPAELIPDYDAALKYLGLSAQTISASDSIDLKPTAAFIKLCTIAKAWNKIDGFVPDFSNRDQYKYYPWFEYRKDAAGFVCVDTLNVAMATYIDAGSRFCFKSSSRAAQFGKMFQDLYNQMFL